MEKIFRPYYLVYKTDEGLIMKFFDSLGEMYNFIENEKSIISYSVFKTLEIKGNF